MTEIFSNEIDLLTWQLIVFSHEPGFIEKFKSSMAELTQLNPFIVFHFIQNEEELNQLVNKNISTFLNLDLACFGSLNKKMISEKLSQIHNNNCYTILWLTESEMEHIAANNGIPIAKDIRYRNNLNTFYIKSIFKTIYNSHLIPYKKEAFSSKHADLSEKVEELTLLNDKLKQAITHAGSIQSNLNQQKFEIELQKFEIEKRNIELEKAFKKSSINHIKLQKAFLQNEEHRKKLQYLLDELQEKNHRLEAQFDEIMAQRDYIEKQNEEIQAQRDMALVQRDKILEQQEEINDNILYASRIQQALFPQKELMDQLLPNHFVLNKPKDVVSGDFYWISQNRQKTVIAVSDCTGHGISGAMMSMLGTAFLNEIITNNDITNSALILEQLRNRVISSLHQDISKNMVYSRDGMDISICIIDIVDYSLEYSGANNPIYIVRNSELIELKADKMPIGIHEFHNEPFSTQKIDILPNDFILMFSDGFADQFGGKKGKKLKYKNFKEILINLENIPIDKRGNHLNNQFNSWKDTQEQIDDVLVLGFTIV